MSTFNDMTKFLRSTWIAKDYIVPCLVGSAGIGKTAAVKEHRKWVAEQLGKEEDEVKLITIIASQILPNEVSGITMPVPETKAMEIFDHYKLSQLRDGDILFFDELLEADQLVLSACLTLIESRQLMSGRKLPKVQIIAATNPTIKPMTLKENIRQRFVWRKFDIDPNGCREYIKDTYGFDIGPVLASLIVERGDEYNILTQRSMTKMAAWMAEANGNKDKASSIANQINQVWNTTLGSNLYDVYMKQMMKPEIQFKNTLRNVLNELHVCDDNYDPAGVHREVRTLVYDDIAFEETSMTDLMDLLVKLPEWKDIEQMLSMMTIEDGSADTVIDF